MPAGDQRIAARMTLAFVAAVLCVGLVLAGASLGATGSAALSQPSPSGSPSGGGGAKIQLINPAQGYDPGLGMPPRQEGTPDRPKISERYDGVDNLYHLVAWVADAPEGAVVEVYRGADIPIGQMSPVPGAPDTFELYWDVPSLTDGNITIRARLFEPTPSGFEEIAMDEVGADVQNRDPNPAGGSTDSQPQDETVELLWPSQGGRLGFFKPKGGSWITVVDGMASNGTSEVSIHYSKSAPGTEPTFTQCGNDDTFSRPEVTYTPFTGPTPDAPPIPWSTSCTLAGTDRPSQVTAIAAVAEEGDKPDRSDVARGDPDLSQDSADVHRVMTPYLQHPNQMNLDLETNETTSTVGQGRRTSGGCLSFLVTVTDPFDRPVQGASIDVHMVGPDDQVRFANEQSPSAANGGFTTGGFKAADANKNGHVGEGGAACDTNTTAIGQADHNVPLGSDIKHIESSGGGTGIGGGGQTTFGEWRFHVNSGTAGFSNITAWIDDEDIVQETDTRETDDDTLEQGEPRDQFTAQWTPGAIRVAFDPAGQTSQTGSCARYIVRVRGGNAPVPDANVDVHLRGPTDEADFCDPSDATPRRAPDAGDHDGEDAGEASHSGDTPQLQHTEGETNDAGNFVVGITSPVAGDASLVAWYDGDRDQDNDLPGTDPSATVTHTWSDDAGQARVNFVNPTPYGTTSASPPQHPAGANGTQVSNKQDVDSNFHVVTRVDSPTAVEAVEILIAATEAGPFNTLGEATRIGDTDTYELATPVNVADGSYILRARIKGTTTIKDQAIVVNRATAQADPPASQQAETAEIARPENGSRVGFSRGATTVTGVASAGAEGVDLFYTKVGSTITPAGADWINCGYTDLSGTGTTPQEFTGTCTLTAGDQADQVTGMAVITYDCSQAGCDASPMNPIDPALPRRNPGQKDSGDAHRVFGFEATPILTIEPAETAGVTGVCQKLTLALRDQTGQSMPDHNVDVHVSGPSDDVSFCDPTDSSAAPRSAPDQGGHTADGDDTDEAVHSDGSTVVHHTEGRTLGNGRFVFGVESDDLGDTQILGWLDRNGDDLQDGDEQSDSSIVHWEEESGDCDVTGTNGGETLVGTAGDDRICAFGGNDFVRGRGGDDIIFGGPGRDKLRGNGGNDTVKGNGGNDRASGGRGSDLVVGGKGRDRVNGAKGNDRLRGNQGNDFLDGGSGRDGCAGGAGRDRQRRCERVNRRSFAARPRLI